MKLHVLLSLVIGPVVASGLGCALSSSGSGSTYVRGESRLVPEAHPAATPSARPPTAASAKRNRPGQDDAGQGEAAQGGRPLSVRQSGTGLPGAKDGDPPSTALANRGTRNAELGRSANLGTDTGNLAVGTGPEGALGGRVKPSTTPGKTASGTGALGKATDTVPSEETGKSTPRPRVQEMEVRADAGEHTVLLQRMDFRGQDLPSAIPDYEVEAPDPRCIPCPRILPMPPLQWKVRLVPCP